MSKLFEGSIAVKVINGRNGDFTVGTFETDLGVFKIRDPLLDQFEEGEYRVKAVINKLSINSYLAKQSGILITNIEADISSIDVLEEKKTPVQEDRIEPDVTVEDKSGVKEADKKPKSEPKKGKIVLGKKKKPEPVKQEGSKDEGNELADLFGHLWPLDATVSLDMAAPRQLIVKQVSELKKLGYKFDASKQRWNK